MYDHLSDSELFLTGVILGVARWIPGTRPTSGEVAVSGIRWPGEFEENCLLKLTSTCRAKLEQEIMFKRTK